MAGKYLSLLVHFTRSTAGREPWSFLASQSYCATGLRSPY